jgi:hypothetical protein
VAVCWAVGVVATNVIGQRLLNRGERWLMMIPVFRTIYAPVKQLVAAFSPENESGFKRVVMVEDPHRGWVMGFLTKEFTVDRGAGPRIDDGGVLCRRTICILETSFSTRETARSSPTFRWRRASESF